MRILALCNISNIDDPESDSGIIFQRILGAALSDRGNEYHLILPYYLKKIKNRFPKNRVHYANIGTGRYSSRFGFDWIRISKLIKEISPNIVFVNQIENAAAVKSILVTLHIKNVALISYCHYPPFQTPSCSSVDASLNHDNLGFPVLLSVVSALHTSDAILVQSDYAATILKSAVKPYLKKDIRDIIVLPPPMDMEIAPDKIEEEKAFNNTVIYNHRLYESYGTNKFLTFLENYNGRSIKVIVANPMANRSAQRNLLNGSPEHMLKRLSQIPYVSIVDGSTSRLIYKSYLKEASIAFAPDRVGCVWSMAAVDCLSLGIPVIAPKIAAYPEFIPNSLLFNDWEEAGRILDTLLTDSKFYRVASNEAKESVKMLMPENIAIRMEKIFKNALERLICVE